jgi:hypothetical protein
MNLATVLKEYFGLDDVKQNMFLELVNQYGFLEDEEAIRATVLSMYLHRIMQLKNSKESQGDKTSEMASIEKEIETYIENIIASLRNNTILATEDLFNSSTPEEQKVLLVDFIRATMQKFFTIEDTAAQSIDEATSPDAGARSLPNLEYVRNKLSELGFMEEFNPNIMPDPNLVIRFSAAYDRIQTTAEAWETIQEAMQDRGSSIPNIITLCGQQPLFVFEDKDVEKETLKAVARENNMGDDFEFRYVNSKQEGLPIKERRQELDIQQQPTETMLAKYAFEGGRDNNNASYFTDTPTGNNNRAPSAVANLRKAAEIIRANMPEFSSKDRIKILVVTVAPHVMRQKFDVQNVFEDEFPNTKFDICATGKIPPGMGDNQPLLAYAAFFETLTRFKRLSKTQLNKEDCVKMCNLLTGKSYFGARITADGMKDFFSECINKIHIPANTSETKETKETKDGEVTKEGVIPAATSPTRPEGLLAKTATAAMPVKPGPSMQHGTEPVAAAAIAAAAAAATKATGANR